MPVVYQLLPSWKHIYALIVESYWTRMQSYDVTWRVTQHHLSINTRYRRRHQWRHLAITQRRKRNTRARDVTFMRWDNLQRYVGTLYGSRSSSSRSHSRIERNTYTCKECGRNFDTRKYLTRHVRTAFADVTEPQLLKSSK